MIAREFEATHLNAVLNHPTVRPWVANDDDGVIDMTPAVADKNNVLLMGEHGGCFFIRLQPGVYEVHTQVVPEGRGEWVRRLTEACVEAMFINSECYEIVTRVPFGHIAAKVAAEAVGMRLEFTREKGVMFRNRTVDIRLYSLRIQDWVERASSHFVDDGRMLHDRMEEEAKRLGIAAEPHEDDENHNHYLGIASSMVFAGQPVKGVLFYNRWVAMARHKRRGKLQYVELVSVNPTMIRFDIGLMKFENDDIEVIRTC